MIEETYGKGKYRINLSVHATSGFGLAVFIRGGDRPHLGGVALASPGARLEGEALSSCDLWTITVPGHKDSELAQDVAKKICKASGEPVSVSLGVHIQDAKESDIKQICENTDKVVALFLEKYL
ncbi:hypothetical protein [Clostridium sp. HBUAS56010]|uniref:prenylated flavin chaperone LpdD n=1 Tax=Clostridium sp. HBUAS56010 TaxID=2571127 RepID=UPI0011788EEC|nr:hypothetical protein [Clostridium sp. HBUAS56010]